MRRIALIGAGTGQSQILRGLRNAPARVTAIVGVTDNGGHSGLLRRRLRIPAVGDLRNCLAALAPRGSRWERLLSTRFSEGALDGISVGNLVLASLAQSTGSVTRAAERMCGLVGSRHRVIPAGDADAQVGVELKSGARIVGEWEILQRKDPSRIVRVFHEPAFRAPPEARRAIEQADLVVLCPGTLFTGVLSCAIAQGLPQALRRSRARFVMILNIMTQPGQTAELTARGHVEAVQRAVGRRPDAVVVNTGRPLPSHLRLYARLGARPVEDDLGPDAWRADLVYRRDADHEVDRGRAIPSLPHLIRHDPGAVARLVRRLGYMQLLRTSS